MTTPAVQLILDTVDKIAPLDPRSERGVTWADFVARLAFNRCMSRYQAIGTMLSLDLTDEGQTLMRPLLQDSQRLQIIERNPARRNALLLGWLDRGFVVLIAQVGAARRGASEESALDDFASGVESWVRAQQSVLHKLRARLGVAKLDKFPADGGSIARALGQPADEIDYVMSTNSSHSSMSSSFRHFTVGDSAVAVTTKNPDPKFHAAVSDRSTRHAVRAAAATGAILGWRTVDELRHVRDETIGALDRGELLG
jgi:hypothetical protein